jgi:hypothetical protein
MNSGARFGLRRATQDQFAIQSALRSARTWQRLPSLPLDWNDWSIPFRILRQKEHMALVESFGKELLIKAWSPWPEALAG